MAGKNFDISKFAATLKPVSESDTMLEISIDDIRDNPRNFYPLPDTQSLRALGGLHLGQRPLGAAYGGSFR